MLISQSTAIVTPRIEGVPPSMGSRGSVRGQDALGPAMWELLLLNRQQLGLAKGLAILDDPFNLLQIPDIRQRVRAKD